MDKHKRSSYPPPSCVLLLLSVSLFYVSTVRAIICPSSCRCDRRERSVACSGYNYLGLPKMNVPPAVRTFSLTNQSILYFDDTWSDLGLDLREIKLINCQVSNMSANALRGFGRLRILHLNFNSLSEVPYCISNSSSIRDLRMSDNEIDSLSVDTFQSLSELRILELAYNWISELPDEIFWNLSELRVIDLSNNMIGYITRWTFINQTKLTDLNISNNQVTSLSFGWLNSLTKLWDLKLHGLFTDAPRFDNISTQVDNLIQLSDGLEFSNIEILDISYNYLTEIPCHCWETMKTLITLRMVGNSFETVPSYCFSELRDLHDISLDHNSISHLGQFAFANVMHLRSIELAGNNITHLPPNFMNGSKLVTYLNLDQNQFTYLPSSFVIHGMLDRLNMQNNLIDNISETAFMDLPKLSMLDFRGNRLTSLTTELKSAWSLRFVQMIANEISFVDEDAFSNNTRLQGIWLDYNRLSTISYETFLPLPRLVVVSLKYNPWYCDCRIKWMHTQVQIEMGLPQYEWLAIDKKIRCSAPKRLKKVFMRAIKYPNKLICSSFPPPLTIKLIVGISLSIVGLSTALYIIQLYCKARKLERNGGDPGKCIP
ncbi:uncharacterized protein [Apostichopus japonicus]|uniref:uncharacterized protein n=1 Tax=Stichopus japonicus TaxID=307972 RepID=UPI003AB175DB